MISALAGLPSLGGMGGGFDGGSLPLLGFGLLSTFASSLTTRSFQGPTTNIPDLSSQANINFGNFNTNFGSYTGNGSNTNGYFWNSAPYGDNPSLHTGPSDFRAWHQWATGGVQPPLAVAPFYGQGFGYTNVQFGSAGAYSQAGYGSTGAYGASGGYGAAPVAAYPYSASPAYAPTGYGSQPIFSNAYQAMGVVQQNNYTAVPNYTPVQTYIPPSNYTPPTYNYTPPAQTYNTPATYPTQPQSHTTPAYGSQPTPEQTANFNNYAQDAIARFNSTGSSITGQYQGATGMPAPGYTPASYAPPDYSQPAVANPYTGQPTAEQTARFNNYAQEALARFNSTGASINLQYAGATGTAPNYTPPARDITYSLPAQPTPAYGTYLNNYQSLPNYGSASYGAYNLGYGYPQPQPPVFYGSALPSYTAPLIQQQTPYGYGGPPQPAPSPPPAYPSRPPHPTYEQPPAPPTPPAYPPVAQQPPTPPAYPPVAEQPPTPPAYPPVAEQPPTPPVYYPPVAEQPPAPPPVTKDNTPLGPSTPVAANPTRPGRVEYPLVPVIQQDVAGPASVLGSRLTGDPAKIASFTATNPAPNQNQDALHFDRRGAYTVMQQDSSLRYNVDTGRFFRTYDGGATKDVLDMAQVSQMLRQDHPNNYARVGQLLQHLPTDNQLFGSQEQAATPSGSFAVGGATQTQGFAPPVRIPNLPPLNTPVLPPLKTPELPPFAGFGNSGGQSPELDSLLVQRQAGQITGDQFNLALLQIAANQGAINPNPAPPVQGVPFQLTAHRYWDPQRGDYANVSEVTTQGYQGEDQRVFNTLNQTSVSVTRNDVPIGTPVRVTVNWDNGQSRTWDYHIAGNDQSDVDVFSPIG